MLSKCGFCPLPPWLKVSPSSHCQCSPHVSLIQWEGQSCHLGTKDLGLVRPGHGVDTERLRSVLAEENLCNSTRTAKTETHCAEEMLKALGQEWTPSGQGSGPPGSRGKSLCISKGKKGESEWSDGRWLKSCVSTAGRPHKLPSAFLCPIQPRPSFQ